jgi:predicted O-linked N-acetylglucosamine transferase (SPINDLY family)
VHSNLIYTLLFHLRHDPGTISEEHHRWNLQFAEPLRQFFPPHSNDRDPERRLRIGYVSPDFRHHPVGRFVKPLLEAHHHSKTEIYAYASVKRADSLTARLKTSVDVWRDVLSMNDEALARQIREDEIDILVDLTQHMEDNRLPVFARKPAPVQVAWLGYPGSTGLKAMDYRLTDAWMEPEGAAWSASVEEPVRLPDSWFCFDPFGEYPERGELPAHRKGHVTFGSLNNVGKLNETVFMLWINILSAVDGSKLLLICPAGETRDRVRHFFQSHGIGAERLELVEKRPFAEYLRLYQSIDIGLDPFPYSGGTTTCDAMWMGVPVVALCGKLGVSRITLSILSTVGLPELIASSQEEYVKIAKDLAMDLSRLAILRATLRERMKTSALMDAPRFARNIEQAYRQMWRTWCASRCCNQSP